MKLTPQHRTILDILSDSDWHCSVEIEFMRDARKRISELTKLGYCIEGKPCTMHLHPSRLFMRRLIIQKPKTEEEKRQESERILLQSLL